MSCILLVDPSDTARMAMRGILARANHRLAVCGSATEAWEFLQRNPRTDLVFTELKLPGGGLGLIERWRRDPFLKRLPIVIYAEQPERDAVRHALSLGLQNVLVKPYHDDSIFAEVRKVQTNPWRNLHFEEERSFSKMMECTPDQLHEKLRHLAVELEQGHSACLIHARDHARTDTILRLQTIATHAEAAGAWGVVECLDLLREQVEREDWRAFEAGLGLLDFAVRLVRQHLAPDLLPPEFLSEQERNSEAEERERNRWFAAAAGSAGPLVDWTRIQQELDALPGCPVIDSAVAAFRMTANGTPACVTPLMDLVDQDPGLATQALIAAGQLKHATEAATGQISDPRLAVGLLGEQKLATLGRSLVVAEERFLQTLPTFGWAYFWMFQIGTARIAQFTCRYLGLRSLETLAYHAGLLHDLGKLLLLRLHPFALQVAFDVVRNSNTNLRQVERALIGCTTREMAAHFAEKNGLHPAYSATMRHLDQPADAAEHAELVAVVSLAHDLCLQNHVGLCGDLPKDKAPPLRDTAAWAVLRHSVFPSFDLHQFETQVHRECLELRSNLHGRAQSYAVA